MQPLRFFDNAVDDRNCPEISPGCLSRRQVPWRSFRRGRFRLPFVVSVCTEKIGHHLNIIVAGVIQTWQIECRLERLEQ